MVELVMTCWESYEGNEHSKENDKASFVTDNDVVLLKDWTNEHVEEEDYHNNDSIDHSTDR